MPLMVIVCPTASREAKSCFLMLVPRKATRRPGWLLRRRTAPPAPLRNRVRFPPSARALANRIWFHLAGTGIVDPIDDFRPTNPPSNPALLAALAAEFVKSGHDLRHLIREITASHSNVSLLDWGTASLQPGVLNNDKVHPTTAGRTLLVKAIAAAVGNVIEWYDFYIFGSLATILSVKFFEKSHPVAALLSTTTTSIGPNSCRCIG